MVGLGPGGALDRTTRAETALRASEVIVGYRRYLDYVADVIAGKEIYAFGMRRETDRCRKALECASKGKTVSLVCSGDAGVYGMAGLTLEIADESGLEVDIEIVPGVTAAVAAAAVVGAPLTADYAAISLSDLLIPWETIRKRLEAVAAADLVVALYNPRSRGRTKQFDEAMAILRRYRDASTPAAVATAVGTAEERVHVTTLGDIDPEQVDMRTIVIVGNSQSRVLSSGHFVTARGYRL
ncbi:MAG: precorrin-3B C(17)-methyltransferase [Planctomycetota bacterium]|nr:MAG: precorrin-3B C(17)-methyltransferase [Planctomycetota bacterium]